MNENISQVLKQPVTPDRGKHALNWATEKLGNIRRGDLMLGIMAEEDLALLPQALQFAGRSGWPEAWTLLVQHQVEMGKAAEAAAALQEGLTEQPELIVPLYRVQQFHLRGDVPEAEQAQTLARLEKWCQAHAEDDVGLYHLGLYNLGLAYFNGFGTPRDQPYSAALHQRAADLGNADALFELYVLHSTGQGVELNYEKALAFLEQAAEKGQLRAMYNMGALHATGEDGAEFDLDKAFEWYERAARAGHEKAADTLITMYLGGLGVEQDLGRVEELIEVAESFGHDMSLYREDLKEERDGLARLEEGQD